MLVVRQAQIAVFTARAWSDFFLTAGELLLDQHAVQMEGTPAEAQRRRVRWSLLHARARGLREGDTLMLFARCLLTYGPAFAAHPTIAEGRRSPGEADAHWRRLYAGMPDDVWRELVLLYADEDWAAVDRDNAAGVSHGA